MSEEEARDLLRAARDASATADAARDAFYAASADRRAAVQAAMDAGIPRKRIAESLGVHVQTLYQITRGRYGN